MDALKAALIAREIVNLEKKLKAPLIISIRSVISERINELKAELDREMNEEDAI